MPVPFSKCHSRYLLRYGYFHHLANTFVAFSSSCWVFVTASLQIILRKILV